MSFDVAAFTVNGLVTTAVHASPLWSTPPRVTTNTPLSPETRILTPVAIWRITYRPAAGPGAWLVRDVEADVCALTVGG